MKLTRRTFAALGDAAVGTTAAAGCGGGGEGGGGGDDSFTYWSM